MSIYTENITDKQRDTILLFKEGHFLDLKSVDIAPGKLTKTISAFANADGGELYIGIDEIIDGEMKKRIWRGFSDIESANAHIQVFEELFPLGQYFNYIFLSNAKSNGYVLKVEISKTKDIVKSSDGKVYLRRGAQNLPISTEEALHRLKLDKGITSFVTETVDTSIERVSNSYVIIKFLLDIIPTAEPINWLKKQELIRGDKPTVAGILLFDDEPQAVLPKRCGIKIYRYRTPVASRESLAFDPITIEGCLYDQIKMAVSRTVELIQDIKILKPNGLQTIEYPFVTLHEIITNAVLHRDYSLASDVHIRIFDNRIEVESPGKLPGSVTVRNILDSQLARNGSIVRLINKFPDPPNKDVGEGLNTAFDAMRSLKLKDPLIQETENTVIVHIRHEPLASPEELILEYLQHNSEINNSKAREICFIGSENVTKRIFERMMKSNLIEKVPGRRGKATAYRIIDEQEVLE